MKKKKLAKAQKKLKRAVRKVSKGQNPGWVAALSAIAGAVTTALSDAKKRGRVKEIASTGKERVQDLVSKRPKEEQDELPNGMVMDENPGPV